MRLSGEDTFSLSGIRVTSTGQPFPFISLPVVRLEAMHLAIQPIAVNHLIRRVSRRGRFRILGVEVPLLGVTAQNVWPVSASSAISVALSVVT